MEGKRAGRLRETLGRYKYVLAAAAAGVLLMLLPGEKNTRENGADFLAEASPVEMEKRLEGILGKMKGVGQVDVLLTVQSGTENVLAADTDVRYRGAVQAPDDYERNSHTVTVPGGSGVVVTHRNFPRYRGALVVCGGGGDDEVCLRIIEAVSALTGLGSDRVAVVEWGEENSFMREERGA